MLFLIVVVCVMFVIIVFVNYFTEPNLLTTNSCMQCFRFRLHLVAITYIGYNNKYGLQFKLELY